MILEQDPKRRAEQQKALEASIIAMAKGPLVGIRTHQAGSPILLYQCICGARFGSPGHDARVVRCNACGELYKVSVEG